MVHGICSSAGCFSMTDPQIAEIYAHRARGLQRRPARDSDAVLSVQDDGREPRQASARSEHRVLEAAEERLGPFRGDQDASRRCSSAASTMCSAPMPTSDVSAHGACPALHRDDEVESAVAAKQAQDDAAVAALVAKGVKPIRLVYEDGGQNPVFAGKSDVEPSRCAGRGAARNRARQHRQADPGGRRRSPPRRQQGRRGRDPARRVRRRRHPRQARRDARLRRHHVRRGDGACRCARFRLFAARFRRRRRRQQQELDEQPLQQGRRRRNAFAGDPGLRAAAPVPSDVPLPPKRSASADTPVRMANAAKSDDAKPAAATQ